MNLKTLKTDRFLENQPGQRTKSIKEVKDIKRSHTSGFLKSNIAETCLNLVYISQQTF